MAITQAEAKKRLSALSAQGGGIINGAKKLEIEANSNILVIGLGGLGCRTVNEIAGIYKRDFVDQGRLSVMTIDTDIRCFNKINSLNGGNIEQRDMFSLYDDNLQDLLKHPRSPYIKSFVSDEVQPEKINNQGARQRRVVGKLMLCAGPAYNTIRSEIERRMIAMGGGAGGRGMQIIIVAGISGGTGSGTFIDISYMVRELAKDNGNNSVFGVFYTPDVQRNEPFCDASNWQGLQRNGYASMKELDYFMSVGADNKVVYTLPLNVPIDVNGQLVNKVESKLPIFERKHVFIVSETDTNQTEKDIVGATATSLLNLFRRSDEKNGDNTQNILSNLCNNIVIQEWDNQHIGVCNDPNGQADLAKIKRTNYPASMHYHYASFDYKSIYIPRNEMVAYCTSLILNDLLHNKFLKAMETISDNEVAQLAVECNLDSIESIYGIADVQSGWHNMNFRIQSDSAAYPQAGFLGVKCDASAAVEEATRIAANALNAISADMNTIWSVFENALKTNLLNNTNLWNLVGPYGIIVFMSGNGGNGITGLIQHIQNLKNDVASKLQALQQACDTAQSAMTNYQRLLAADLRVTDAEILRMVDLCEVYSKAYFDYQLFAEAMPQILNAIEFKLVEFNNQTFETYVPMMKAIEEIVNEDADRFMHSTLEHNGYGSVFCVDAFNIDNALNNSTLFSSFFDGYLSNQEVIDAENTLFSTLFSPENRNYWEALTNDQNVEMVSNNAVQQVRQIFNSITTPLIQSMLEKFLVMIYCDPNTFKNAILQPGEDRPITLNDLSDFWVNHPQERDGALEMVADKIIAELKKGNMIKFDVMPNVQEKFKSSFEVVSIPDLPDLNQKLRVKLNEPGKGRQAFSVVGPDGSGNYPRTEIALFRNSGPFPLPFVSRMRQYAISYFASEQSVATSAGRHGDEVAERWQENMPELYGVDAEAYFAATRNVTPISDAERPRGNHDQRVFDEVRVLAKDALAGNYLYLPANETRYKMVVLKKEAYAGNPQMTVDEVLEKILNKLKVMLSACDLLNGGNANLPTWVDAAKELGDEEHDHNAYYYLEEHYLDVNVQGINGVFSAVQSVEPEFDYEISNLERLIRMDMKILNELRDEAVFYRDKDFFGEIGRLTRAICREQGLEKLVGYYLAAYKLGWISVDRGYLICTPDIGEPEILLDCRAGFGKGLDEQLLPFLKLAAFCAKVQNNDILKKRIQESYAKYQLTDDQLTPEQISVKSNMPDWKAEIMLPLRTTMESTAFKDYDMETVYNNIFKSFLLSGYQNAYGYPLEVNCAKDILDNVNKVLDALDYYNNVGDNRLVPPVN